MNPTPHPYPYVDEDEPDSRLSDYEELRILYLLSQFEEDSPLSAEVK